MKELLQRLSAVDEDASAAMKIILHFDTLLSQGAGLESFVRGAAVLSGYPAGLAHPQHQIWLRIDQNGRSAPPVTDVDLIRTWAHHDLGDGSGALVWVERSENSVIDSVLLERLAAGVHLTLERISPLSIEDDAAAVEILLAKTSGDARRKAAARLRLRDAALVTVVASPAEAPPPFPRLTAIISTDDGDVRASIVESVSFPGACQAGVGSPVALQDLPTSWTQAQVALRMSTSLTPIVRWESLGGLSLLAQIPIASAQSHPDVVALGVAIEESGTELIEALARTDSARAASATLGLHHSTVQVRQARLEQLLGFKVGTAEGRTRLMIALALHRLTTPNSIG